VSAAPPILVLNAGSATLRFGLLGPACDLASGTIELVGEAGGPADHAQAVQRALESLPDTAPAAVGHRVVHGGPDLHTPVLIDDAVTGLIDRLTAFAPAHHPAALAGIRAARHAYPDVAQVAVFDTAFHATLPPAARTCAIDRDVATRYGIRRYGFHGISVRYVRDRTSDLLGRPVEELNLVVLHLGNGASATALAGGVSVETSMGMTPLAGLMMGTRCGDLDPAITFHLARAGWSLADIEDLYQRRAGLTGLCGDHDMRSVQARAARGDPVAGAALDAYCHRIRCYVGAYHAVLGRLDAIVFTAGVGEHSATVRARALAGLDPLGIEVDPVANRAGTAARLISPPAGRVAVCVVPTDEERAIASDVGQLLDLPGW
jgi:acetate kinase